MPSRSAAVQSADRFRGLHCGSGPAALSAWRDFLTRADFPCHYVTPEFFSEPLFTARSPFAVLIRQRGDVVAVCTGILDRRTAQCGLISRPQLAIDPEADQTHLARSLAAAFRQVHPQANAVSLFAWTPMPALTSLSYREQVYSDHAGIVLLDLRRGPDALFREFSESRRANIRKGIRRGIEVAEARSDDEIGTYYEIYKEWSRRKNQPALDYDLFLRTVTVAQQSAPVPGALRRGDHRRGERQVLSRRRDRIRGQCLTQGGPVAEAQRPSALARDRMGLWRGIPDVQPRGGAPVPAAFRRDGGEYLRVPAGSDFGRRLEARDRLVATARSLWRQLPEPLRTKIRSSGQAPQE